MSRGEISNIDKADRNYRHGNPHEWQKEEILEKEGDWAHLGSEGMSLPLGLEAAV